METPKLFIGLDIHKKNWAIDIRTDLFHHKFFSIEPKAKILEEYVEKHFSGYEVNLCYEAGSCGFSTARYFSNLAWKVTVVNPSDIPTTDKHTYQKTDKLDAKNLSKCLSNNTLTAIYIPTEREDFLRCLVRQRNSVVKQKRSVKNRIKSFFLFMGTAIPEEFSNNTWSKAFIEWISQQYSHDAMGKATLSSQLAILAVLQEQYLSIANQLRAYYRVHQKEEYYLLQSVPGIGGYLASVILSELGDFSRFKNEKVLSSYVGLVPGTHESSDSEKKMHLTPRSRGLLRSYLIESAWVAVRIDPEMQSFFRKHQGKNEKNAIVKVAHKLLKRIYSVIKNKQPYQVNIAQFIERRSDNVTSKQRP
jgi:transposase